MQSLNITIAFPTAAAIATAPKADSPAATLVAERFKTRLCKTFRKTGECAFLARCMFAHGKEDLRTTERNVADGLVTEAAVKNWQRATIRADEKKAVSEPVAAAKLPIAIAFPVVMMSLPAKHAVVAPRAAATVVSLPVAEPASPRSVSPSEVASAVISPRVAPPAADIVAATPVRAATRAPVRRYRHDPYAQFSAWQPLLESASDSAESTPRALQLVHSSPLSAAMGRANKAPMLPAPIAGILMP